MKWLVVLTILVLIGNLSKPFWGVRPHLSWYFNRIIQIDPTQAYNWILEVNEEA
ncbi:MAG: hypothetical protein Q7S31_03520 [bacterium]|nr:hypothetical protein [bacterium]